MSARPLSHIRNNLVAYLALIIALSGTGYAAIRLPANSVGAPQIRNHSITPVKLDPSSIAGTLRYVAVVAPNGRIISSTPRARTVQWGTSGGIITWGQRIPTTCITLATVGGVAPPEGVQSGFATAFATGNQVYVGGFAPSGAIDAKRVQIGVFCP
jgi:hypothetical protein